MGTGENGRELGMAASQNWGRKLGTEGEKNWGLNWGKLFSPTTAWDFGVACDGIRPGSSNASNGRFRTAKRSMSLNSVGGELRVSFHFPNPLRLSSRFFFALLPVDDAAAVEEDDAVAADARSLASARADAAASGGGVAAGSLLLVQLPQASSARSADIDKTNSSIENSLLIFVCFFLSVKPAAGETGDAELGILAPKTGETPNWGRPAPKTGETNWGRKVAKTGEIPSSHLYYSTHDGVIFTRLRRRYAVQEELEDLYQRKLTWFFFLFLATSVPRGTVFVVSAAFKWACSTLRDTHDRVPLD
jgi:hypothetical protein